MGNSEQISHYTTLHGFRSIIESEVIWATNVMYLNDSKEYFHAFDVFRVALERFSQQPDLDNEDGRYFLSECKSCIDGIDEIGAEQHFILSLSENLDQLSQWRAYGSIGIVFNVDRLRESFFEKSAPVSEFDYCKYNEASLDEEIFTKLLKLYDAFSLEKLKKGKGCIHSLIVDFQLYLYDVAAFYKHGGFHEECEVRVSCFSEKRQDLKFRSTDSYLVPYIEVPFDLKSIDSIMIGPCVDPARTEKSIKMFLDQKFSGRPPAVLKSKSPYRNW